MSVKIPARILNRMPKAGSGRSGFIAQAIEEKLARQPLVCVRGGKGMRREDGLVEGGQRNGGKGMRAGG